MLTLTGSSAYCPSSLCTCSHELTQAYVHTDKTAYLVFAHICSLLQAAALTAHCPSSLCTGSHKTHTSICSHRQHCIPSLCTYAHMYRQQRILLQLTQSLQARIDKHTHVKTGKTAHLVLAQDISVYLQSLHVCSHRQHYPPFFAQPSPN